MKRLIRFLAVIALALSPVWGYSADVAASGLSSPAHYPVWPSFLSTGCSAIQGPGGSTTIVCGQGAFLLTQVNSGYECNRLDINVATFSSGPFLATATVNSGSQSNSVSIDDSGDYYMDFPGFLTNNLITIQISSPDAGSMTIGFVQTIPCPVATSTPTVNPSFTPTNTPVPVTGTPTAIPTHTPLPSGHSTFTPSVTPTGTVSPAPSATPTPGPASIGYNCGDANIPLLNCNLVDGVSSSTAHVQDAAVGTSGWKSSVNFTGISGNCLAWSACLGMTQYAHDAVISGSSPAGSVYQDVVVHATGNVWISGNDDGGAFSAGSTFVVCITTASPSSPTACTNVTGSTAFETELASVVSGTTYHVLFEGGGNVFAIEHMWVSASGSTPLPTATDTVTSTPVPGTPTDTAIPSDTPIPIPGAMSTAIATSTECPGGCAVAALTAIPGLSTVTTVDTSPFSQLQHLSLARNGCTAFGYVQIPYPVIHGTPVLGSTNPLSVTWTLPITHDWDNTQPFSNTAIEPCAMNEIPTFVWDFTYWLSVFACSVIFIMWLIGLVGRLSGDETING